MINKLKYYKNKKVELENLKNETNKINLLDNDINIKIKECNKIIKQEEEKLEKLILTKNKIDGHKESFKNYKKVCFIKTIIFSCSTTLISTLLASANPTTFATLPIFTSLGAFTVIEVLVYFNKTKNLRKLVKNTNYGALENDIKISETTILNNHKKINVYENAKSNLNKFLSEKAKEINLLNSNSKNKSTNNELDIEISYKTR